MGLFQRVARPAILAASRSQVIRRAAEGLPLTRSVVLVWRSRRKTSLVPLPSLGTALAAEVSKVTKRPLPEIFGRPLAAPSAGDMGMLTLLHQASASGAKITAADP